MMTQAVIEARILAAGSDDLGTFGGQFEGGVHVQQIPDELAPALAAIIASGVPIRSYLEIGVAAGGTARIVADILGPATLVLVDDNKHHKAGLRPGILAGLPVLELIGRSDDEPVLDRAFGLAPYDLVHIDGDHHYPGVKLDTINYGPMVRPGGFLMLHDSACLEWGVPRVVRELQALPAWDLIGDYRSATHPRPLGVALFRKVTA